MRLTKAVLEGMKVGATTTSGKAWREAATLIIAVQPPNMKKGVDYLVMQRSPQSSFYPNGICFPGGTVSKADSSSEWIDLFRKSGTHIPTHSFFHPAANRPPIYEGTDEGVHFSKETVLRITAIRETFEECGILICKPMNQSVDLRSQIDNESEILKWQKKIKHHPELFFDLCNQLNVVPDVHSLYDWSNWLTPTTFPPKYRFDTMFYLTILEECPKVYIDKDEVAEWFVENAETLIDPKRGGTGSLTPPQIYEVTRLKSVLNVSYLKDLAKLRQEKGLERWCPKLRKTKDGILSILPGDDLYGDTSDIYEQAPMEFVDSTYAQLSQTTKNQHRVQLEIQDDRPKILINMAPRYGQIYPA